MTTVHAYADDSSTRLGVTLDQIREALDERGLLPAKAWGRRQFDAHCPCHQDKRPSLSIGETDDGRDLIHCHAGCDRVEILQALGLWHDRLPPLLRLLPSLNTPETTDHRVKQHCGGTGRTPTSNVPVSLWSPPERWRRRAAVLGVHAEPGESFECVIPGHQHEAKIERADGKRRYRCGSRPHGWSFAEVFVSVRVGSEQRLGAGPLTSRWFDLLSHEAGLLQPTPVVVTAPRRCGDTAAHVAQCIALLLGLRAAGGGHGPHEPFTFARDFAIAYCGINSTQARRAMNALERHGSIVRAGDVAVWGQHKAILWRLPK